MSIVMTSGYSEDTRGAKLCLERAHDLVDAAATELMGRAVPAVTVVDYGAADGGTALDLYRRMLAGVKGADRVTLVLNDLPSADLSTLTGNGRRALEAHDEALLLLSPVSFYDPVAPPASVHLGFSATAMHWLRQRPMDVADHTHANATPDEASRETYRSQARRDWTALMTERARELAPGGHLITVNLAQDEAGHFLGHNGRDEPMHDILHGLWKQLVSEGAVTEAEYRGTSFQNFYKRRDDFLFAFEPGQPAHNAGLRVVAERTESIPCPYRQAFDEDGDVARFAAGLMRTVRSWSEHTFRAAVGPRDGGSDPVAELYRRFEAAIAERPTRFSMDYVEHYLHVRKELSR